MGVVDSIKNLYYGGEDAWYNMLDSINEKIPVYKIVDPIDTIFPSFALFLILIFVIIILAIVLLFSSGITTTGVEAVVIVTSDGLPVAGANVMLSADCQGSHTMSVSEETDSSGETELELCADKEGKYDISVSKQNFDTITKTVDMDEDNIITINLSALSQEQRSVFASITDEDGNPVDNVSVEMICLTDLRNEEINPDSENNYQFEIFEDCSTIQLKASAQNYETETKNLDRETTRIEIILKESENKGRAVFEVKDPSGPIYSAEITLTDEIGKNHILFTDSEGFAIFEDLPPQNYTYSANDSESGRSEEGVFEISPNNTTEIEILFEAVNQEELDNKKRIYLKVVDDTNTPLPYTSMTIFKDGNVYTKTQRTDSEGEVKLVVDETSEYVVSINKIGYQMAIQNVQLRTLEEGPQIIILRQGGGTLKVNVVDEDEAAISGSQLELYLDGFSGYLDSSQTDFNGQVTWDNLPSGDFTIIARKTDSEGEATVSLEEDDSKEITIQMIIGEGEIKFDLKKTDGRTKINVDNYEIFAKTSGDYISTASGSSLRYYFETGKEKHGTKIKSIISDSNYFPYETLEYTIYKGRTAEKKELFIREKDDLPNENKVQMFFQEAYNSNPLNKGSPDNASTIESGKRYYLLFHVVLNHETSETHDLITNFFVGPEEETGLLERNPLTIQNIESVDGSVGVMSHTNNSFRINYLDESVLVNEDAKQANVLADDVEGPKVVPIILTIDVDLNAEIDSVVDIFYNAEWGDYNSLDYVREFEIGKKFCIGADCPTFLFSNYIRRDTEEDGEFESYDKEDPPVLYIGDDYTLKTSIENLSDQDFGEVNLEVRQSSNTDRILIDENSSAQYYINATPLSIINPVESSIHVLDSYPWLRIEQQITKYAGATDLMEDYEGVENEVKIKTSSKDQLKIVPSPKVIYEGQKHPMLTLEVTNDTLKEQTRANWKVEIEGQDGLFNGLAGQTDVNGFARLDLDASTLSEGDKLIFTTYASGMLDGTYEIEVEGVILYDVEEEIDECVSYSGNDEYSLNVGSTGTFTVTSDCENDVTMYMYTDQSISPKQFNLSNGDSQTVTITGYSRDGIIGAYPLQILKITNNTYSQVKLVDVIVNDGGCFSIDNATIDLQYSDTDSSTVTNNCFDGRKDIYYPQATLSTVSASMAYDKSGIPEQIEFTPVVTCSAIEEIVYGQLKTDVLYSRQIGGDGSSGGWNAIDIIVNVVSVLAAPYTGGWSLLGIPLVDVRADSGNVHNIEVQAEEVYFLDEAQEMCAEYAYELDPIEKPEPDVNLYNVRPATSSYDSSEIVGETGSSGNIIETDEEETIEVMTPWKPRKALFATVNSGDFPAVVHEDDEGDLTFTSVSNELGQGLLEAMSGEPSQEAVGETPAQIDTRGVTIWNVENAGQRSIAQRYTKFEIAYFWTFLTDLYGNLGLGAPRPPNWETEEDWRGGTETGFTKHIVTDDLGCSNRCRLEDGGYIGDGDFYLHKHVKGDTDIEYFSGGDVVKADVTTAHLIDVVEMYRNVIFQGEQKADWNTTATIVPSEGVIYEIGGYDAMPLPEWLDEKQVHGNDPGDSWNLSDDHGSLYTAVCVIPNGFIDLESAIPPEDGEPFEIPDASDPLVEYQMNGNLKCVLDEETIPNGVNAFLYNSSVYAEYVGEPEFNSPNINLEFTRNGLLGTEYAIITLKDWTGDSVEEKAIQVKLQGPESNCVLSDGTKGFTGETYSPRLLFDWDWNSISKNQCDSDNSDYTYCDATQFTISLFKKLKEIEEDYYEHGRLGELGEVTSFYAYLIRDNYSQEFLEDFDNYYSSELSTGSSWFNSSDNVTNYDILISDNGLSYSGGDLPYGGAYQVTLDIQLRDEGVSSLFFGGQSNADIEIEFIPIQEAPNYNPFYETPFDGGVQKNGERQGYGTSVSGTEINLKNGIPTSEYANSLQNITTEVNSDLETLNSEILLIFNSNSNTLEFNPAQPSPVIMTVDGTSSAIVDAQYYLQQSSNEGYSNISSPDKKWSLIGSTIGDNSGCRDFEGQSKSVFTATGTTQKTISWEGNEKGTLELGTTFFTPKNPTYSVSPGNTYTTLNSKDSLYNAGDIILTNFFSSGIDNYDNIKGVFEMLEEEKVCMSVDSRDEMKIWWNPEYLEEEIRKVETTTSSCS